jgi:hypothetical protein
MIVSRTLHLGLFVFAVALIVGTIVEMRARDERTPAAVSYEAVSVLDVARSVRATEVPSLLRLRPGERIAAVGDQEVGNDIAAGVLIAERALGPGQFLDLIVQGPSSRRRVLVLMH